MLQNLKKAIHDRETVTVGGGEFSPLEVQQFVREVEGLQKKRDWDLFLARHQAYATIVAAIIPELLRQATEGSVSRSSADPGDVARAADEYAMAVFCENLSSPGDFCWLFEETTE